MTLAPLLVGALALTGPTPDSLVYSGRARDLDVVPPRLEAPSIELDGVLNEGEWERAAVLTDFTQYEPVEGTPPSEATEVRVFYADDAIYFGVRAFDREPELVQARLGERDRAVFNDDWVRIMLDTFDDRRQAYVFYVNPLGIQGDGLWVEGMRSGSVPVDFNPDFIWQSKGRVTEQGWSAEIRIPYLSLRFREVPSQSWGFNVAREVKRRGFKQAWAPLTRDNPSTLAQGGHLRDLQDIHPRRLLEVTPVITGRRTGELHEGEFVRDDFDPDFGMNARYGVTRNLTLDATVNPDFSQVEADANRLTVNERFAIFFPEKRPFFLEGSEIWRMPRNLVHTRQIVDPAAGAKLTGKVGAFQLGYLGAVDRSPGNLVEGADDAIFNVVRLRRDVGSGSTLGAVYTDRTRAGDDYNRVVGVDARLLLGRYTLTTQLASSWTSTPRGGPGGGLQPLISARVARSGRSLAWTLRFEDIHPDFRTRTGFINRVGDAQLFGSIRYTHFGSPGARLESVSTELRVDNFFDHDGLWNGEGPVESEIELQPTLSFRGGRTLTVILRNGYFRFEDGSYPSYRIQGSDGSVRPFPVPPSLTNLKAVAALPRMRITNEVSLNGRVFFREVPIFAEGSRGLELQVGPDLTLQPTRSLSLSVGHTWSKITRDRDDSVFSTAHVSRLTTQYQFSRAALARAIVQYDLEERDRLLDPTSGRPIVVGGSPVAAYEAGDFEAQFLLQYEPSPGTIFYIGYSRLERGERTFGLGGMEPVEEGLFVKLSYLFRM